MYTNFSIHKLKVLENIKLCIATIVIIAHLSGGLRYCSGGGDKKHPKGGVSRSRQKVPKSKIDPLLFPFLAVFRRRGEFRFFLKKAFFYLPPRTITQSPLYVKLQIYHNSKMFKCTWRCKNCDYYAMSRNLKYKNVKYP